MRLRRARWVASKRNGSGRLRTSRLCPTVLRQFHLSGGNPEQAAPGDRQGRVYPRVGFIVAKDGRVLPSEPSRSTTSAVHASNGSKRARVRSSGPGCRAERWLRTRCGLQLHALAYNLGNFLRTLATPEPIEDWSLTSLKEQLIKIGAKVASHSRYIAFQIAEVAIPRQMFQEFFAAHCGTTAATTARASVSGAAGVMRSTATDGRSAPRGGKIAKLASRPPLGCPRWGGCRHLATVLHLGPTSPNIHASPRAVRGIMGCRSRWSWSCRSHIPIFER